MSQWWVADSEARVLGPVSLEALAEAAAQGKLKDVRVASRDGRTYAPIAQHPEVLQALQPRKYEQAMSEQQASVDRLKEWQVSARTVPFLQLLMLPDGAPADAVRSTFFALLQRFYPDRLPADASAALRRACEDAFLALCDRMIGWERQWPGDSSQKPQGDGVTLEWRGQTLEVRLDVRARDVRVFTAHPELSVRSDGLFVPWTGPVAVGTPVKLTIKFQGHPSAMALNGRVVEARGDAPALGHGFGVKLLELAESDRSFIRAYVARAGSR